MDGAEPLIGRAGEGSRNAGTGEYEGADAFGAAAVSQTNGEGTTRRERKK